MRSLHRLAAVAVFALSLSFAVSARGVDPFRSPEKKTAKPASAAVDRDDPFAAGSAASEDGAWSGSVVSIDANHGVAFGPIGCPVALVGKLVWDLKTDKIVSELERPFESRGLRALSADGRFVAAGSKSPSQTDTSIAVWNAQTGKRVLDVPGDEEAFVDFLAISRSKYLLHGGRHDNQIHVWDIESGEAVKHLTVPDRRVEAEKIAFTPDGKYFACITHDTLAVTSTATNKQAAVMASPSATPGQAPERPVARRGSRFRPTAKIAKPAKHDAVFVYAWTRSLAFSPDGTELAAFSTHPVPRLMVWNGKGKLIVDEPVPLPRTISHRNTLEWQPDGGGWLINGYLFDRESNRVTLSIRTPFAADVQPHLLDENRVIGLFGDDRNRLQTFTIPREKLNASLQQLAAKAPSFLAPGQAVSLQLELSGLRGEEAETRKLLADALTSRLARDGIPVADGQPTVLRLKLSEQAGDTLPIFERQSPFDFRGRDTGRKATEAKGAAVLELVAQGETQPLWRGSLKAMSSRSFREEINDLTVRKSMLEHLSRQLGGIDLPYFIPKSSDFVALPAVVE